MIIDSHANHNDSNLFTLNFDLHVIYAPFLSSSLRGIVLFSHSHPLIFFSDVP